MQASMIVPRAEGIAPPSPLYLALEGRAWLELASVLPAMPFLRRAHTGDGHPVLVLPGWLGDDLSTRVLRWFLRDRGYHAHGWRLGRNLGPAAEVMARLEERFLVLRERHGRTISLIGWSLGGVYARELAHRFPSGVRQVVTLASPFRDLGATSVARFFPAPRRRESGPRSASANGAASSNGAPPRRWQTPPPVPCTSIYSKSDGVVAWRSCLDDTSPKHENVEVQSSHCGMGHHPGVLRLIAERLAQPEGAWRPLPARPSGIWPF